MKMPNAWICPLCNKNMGKIVEVLGDPDTVALMHRQVHIREAAENILTHIDPRGNPVIERYFNELRNALNL